MNIVFWLLIILAVIAVWIIAVKSLFSARVGKEAVDIFEDVKRSMEVEREIKNGKNW